MESMLDILAADRYRRCQAHLTRVAAHMGTDSSIAFVAGRSWRVIVAGGIWLAVYLGARLLIEKLGSAHPSWVAWVACAPVPAFYGFVVVAQRALRGADELGRRIHLEALALAFAATMLVLMTLGLLDLAVPLRDIWILLPLLSGTALAVVSRRYR